jgi:HK97 family phage prohead protease
VQRLRTKVARGDINQMSFGFSGAQSEWDEDYTRRRITSLSIHRADVSVVNFGANESTSFYLRGKSALSLDHYRARAHVSGLRSKRQ